MDVGRWAAAARSLLLGNRQASPLARFGVAIGLAAAAMAAALSLGGELPGYRVPIYLTAAVVAALRGGLAPGFAALALCAVGYVLGPRAEGVAIGELVRSVLLFVAFGVLGVAAASALREGYHQAHRRRRRAERRADVQRVAAGLGVRALAESDLGALLTETVLAVQQALRCDAATLLELSPDGETLLVREVAGTGRDLVGRRLGRDEAPLSFQALGAREAMVVDDAASDPEVSRSVLRERGVVASLVAPVVVPGRSGRSFGIIGAHSRARRRFTADEAVFMQTAANVIGTAVVRLRADERVRRTLASERFLADASRQLALSIEWKETLGRVAKLAVPFLGDWCLVVVVGPDGRAKSVVAESADPGRAVAASALLERYPIDLAATHGVGRILRTSEPELIPEVTSDAFVADDPGSLELRREILRQLGLRSYMGAPLRVADRVVGAIAFGVAEGDRRFGPEDLAVAQALAQRCALALENARLYSEAQEATRVREEVLAVVSHDLQTPLTALLMGARVVDRLAPAGREGDDLRRAAATVRRTAERMGRLIRDLVDAAGMQAGRLSLELREHDALTVAREAVEALQPVASDREVVLELEGEPSCATSCDRDRIHQVLANLMSNAIHVSEPGSRVLVEVRDAEGEVVFTVRDSGPGISPEDLARIFERWYRGRAGYAGSGLGLAIARTIVEAHGGRIWAESQPGEGSAFSFALRGRPLRDRRGAGDERA